MRAAMSARRIKYRLSILLLGFGLFALLFL